MVNEAIRQTERKTLSEGVGESGAFYRSHPLLNFVYFGVIVGITMFSNHPAFLAVSFAGAWIYSVILKGKKALRFNCLIVLPVILITVLLNALNVHNGVTVLFYLNGNRVTLESIVFGCVQAVMLCSAIIWFSCFSVVVTADKFIYLFGRVAPVIALTLSMILRFVPLLKGRFKEVSVAQRCMGRGGNGRGIIGRIRQFGKEVSILIAWSLEASIESADSMEARGYGLHGRTSFHLFRFAGSERWMLAMLLLLGGMCIAVCAMGYTNMYYFPAILLHPLTFLQGISLAAFCLFMLSAIVMDIRGMRQWN